jgi:hypothetical protein
MARQPPARLNGGRPRPRPARRELIPLPKRPYRDSALFHFALGFLLLLVAWLTGGDLTRAVIWATLYIVVATTWSWWHFRQRLRREAEASAAEAGGSPR